MEERKIKDSFKELKKEWLLSENKKEISFETECSSFPHAMLLVNAVAHEAEKQNHHPGIHIDYKKIKFELTSHDVGGLSDRDFRLAHKIELILAKD